MSERRLVSVVEAAKRLGVSEATIRKGCAEGRIPYFQAGARRSIWISAVWIERILDGDETMRPVRP